MLDTIFLRMICCPGLGDKAGAQIVERGHVVEQHAAGRSGRSILNADLAADDVAEIAGWYRAAVEPGKSRSSSRDRPESIHGRRRPVL